MSKILPALGVAFAAILVWLIVRIINRRERWAQRTLAAIIIIPLLYVASFGPACWLSNYEYLDSQLAWLAYRPVTWAWYCVRPSPASKVLVWWGDLFGADHRQSQHGYGLPRPLSHEVRSQNPGVRWL